ncbi:ParB/RepB/Spo0J family partition protein [Nocardia beijingensis]|uniref:ParB/RepB/Spo0J family partition protein n=1 Tax=Nocardia beijingensis TaxID=95162 RepID=UPI00331866F7
MGEEVGLATASGPGREDSEPIQDWLAKSSSLPVEVVSVAKLVPGLSPRTDSSRSKKHIELLSQLDDVLPPIIVHRGTMQVIDGEHRLLAALARGRDSVEVRFFDGSAADAFALAVHANVTHGLPLQIEERKFAATRLLTSHPHWSNRMIARITGLSHKTVGALRGRSTGDATQLNDKRVGIDGKVRRQEIAEGRRTARQLVQQNPQMPLRQLALAANISLGTAHDVRTRYLSEVHGAPPLDDPNSTGTQSSSISTTAKREEAAAVAAGTGREAVFSRLRNDPTLRFTEKGREVLRRLSGSAREVDMIEKLVDALPLHSYAAVAELARANAAKWEQLADTLETRN